jgi:2-oxoglutarate ferredoxin oxidoreductase subunit alpha
MTGNEACAAGALAAGLRFFAGYPITPSSEIAEELSHALPRTGGRFIQMEDEIGAMGAVIGASLTGAKSMTATSGPGFSLKQENLGYASMAEVPCVVVNVQRGGPSTGLPTLPSQADVMQARWGTHGDHPIIVLCPQSVRETFDLTVRAFNLSEKYRIPVVLLLDEIVGHISEKVELPTADEVEVYDRHKPAVAPADYLPYRHTDTDIPEMASFGTGYRFHVTGLCHDETGFPTNDSYEIDRGLRRLNRKMERYRDELVDNETFALDDAEVCVFAFGSTARSARRAVMLAREKGFKAGLLRPKTLWPFPDREVREVAARVRAFVVPELNLGQMAHEVEWAAAGQASVERVNRIDGEPISPLGILETIEGV